MKRDLGIMWIDVNKIEQWRARASTWCPTPRLSAPESTVAARAECCNLLTSGAQRLHLVPTSPSPLIRTRPGPSTSSSSKSYAGSSQSAVVSMAITRAARGQHPEPAQIICRAGVVSLHLIPTVT